MKKTITIVIPRQLYIEREYAEKVCRIGQFDKTCRYLAVGENGYTCAKLIPAARYLIDAQKETYTAQGDNCPGVPMFDPKHIRGN